MGNDLVVCKDPDLDETSLIHGGLISMNQKKVNDPTMHPSVLPTIGSINSAFLTGLDPTLTPIRQKTEYTVNRLEPCNLTSKKFPEGSVSMAQQFRSVLAAHWSSKCLFLLTPLLVIFYRTSNCP